MAIEENGVFVEIGKCKKFVKTFTETKKQAKEERKNKTSCTYTVMYQKKKGDIVESR